MGLEVSMVTTEAVRVQTQTDILVKNVCSGHSRGGEDAGVFKDEIARTEKNIGSSSTSSAAPT